MELSKDTIQGLTNAFNTSIVTDDDFIEILDAAVSYVVQNSAEGKCISKTTALKSILKKKIFADVACLIVEASRHDLDTESITKFLAPLCTDETRLNKFNETYTNNKTMIQSQLQLIGNGPPHIIDVDWHLDYCVKLDTCNSLGVPLYHVQFSTKQHESIRHVKFSCTIQQLQELVFKLKDAVRYLEKLGSA